MLFKNRTEAGKLLAKKLSKYVSENDYVYALPRGGVMVANPVAQALHAPLGLLFVRKIGAPWDHELAVAAVSEGRQVVYDLEQVAAIPEDWLWGKVDEALGEIHRQRTKYLGKGVSPVAEGGVAIIVDDGIATGLTLRAAINEIKTEHPRKIIVAVPIITESIAKKIAKEVDRIVALEVCPDAEFKGAIGSYYEDFTQVSDQQVVTILRRHEREQLKSDIQDVLRNIARY